jgi:hypothetical protein
MLDELLHIKTSPRVLSAKALSSVADSIENQANRKQEAV